MFTGIIEASGRVSSLEKEGDNLHIIIKSVLARELKVDQSIAHNGVCLTVVDIMDSEYTVTAIKETLATTNLGQLYPGVMVNLERAMKLGDRLDGHIVQGHVDGTGICSHIEKEKGSWVFTFEYTASKDTIVVHKGAITIDGISLTVVAAAGNSFSVAIIPYTYTHTNFNGYMVGTVVNLEFDIVGKYITTLVNQYKSG